MQGRIGLGAESDPRGNVEDNFEVRLGFKTKRRENIRAFIELKANENSRDASVHEAFADYRTADKISRLRAGRGKKILGWEYEYSTRDRLSIHRSLAYQYLADRSSVGRDYFLEYQWRSPSTIVDPGDEPGPDASLLIEPETRWKLSTSIHYDESKQAAVILSTIFTPNPIWAFGGWVSWQNVRNQFRKSDYLILVLSSLFHSGSHRAAVELFQGSDPYRTEVERFYGSGRGVHFGSIKAEYGFSLGNWNPYLVTTFIARDLAHFGDRTTEGVFGMRFFVSSDLSMAAEFKAVESVADFDLSTLSYDYTSGAFLARYYF
jgi:hypothetical protein